jgi:hypothetical protein
MPVVLEGVIAWPALGRILPELSRRRLYLKRMQFPGVWTDEDELTAFVRRQAVRRWVQEYHAVARPHVNADLLIERVEDPE